MALIAVDAVVDVAGNALVAEVIGIVSPVAGRALENRIVVRVGMAGGANAVRIAMVDRELRVLRVVKVCIRPG